MVGNFPLSIIMIWTNFIWSDLCDNFSIAIILVGKRESWLLCLICLPGVSWWLSGSSSRCHGVVCSLWLWYFLIILIYYFWTEINCGMQYVGQTGRSLKARFREHFHKMKKPTKFGAFLYRHFKSNGHSPGKIVVQPIEKNIYDPNSSTRLKNIKRHETEL